MAKARIASYQDVTESAAAQERAAFGAVYRQALLDAGFSFLGLLQINTRLRFRPEEARRHLPAPDGEILEDSLINGEIVIVFTHQEKCAFASIENYFGEAILSLRTMLEDGTVIETTTRPTHKHKAANVIGAPQRVTGLMISALMANTVGPGEPWPRVNRPQASYHVQLSDSRDIAELWQIHHSQVEKIHNNHPVPIRAHLSLGFYVCICLRAFMLIEHRGRLNWIITNIFFAIFFLVAIFLIQAVWRQVESGQIAVWFAILATVLMIPALGELTMLALTAASKYLIRILPGPRLVDASFLATIVKKSYLL